MKIRQGARKGFYIGAGITGGIGAILAGGWGAFVFGATMATGGFALPVLVISAVAGFLLCGLVGGFIAAIPGAIAGEILGGIFASETKNVSLNGPDAQKGKVGGKSPEAAAQWNKTPDDLSTTTHRDGVTRSKQLSQGIQERA